MSIFNTCLHELLLFFKNKQYTSAGGWLLAAGDCQLVAGSWWLVVHGWWLAAGGILVEQLAGETLILRLDVLLPVLIYIILQGLIHVQKIFWHEIPIIKGDAYGGPLYLAD